MNKPASTGTAVVPLVFLALALIAALAAIPSGPKAPTFNAAPDGGEPPPGDPAFHVPVPPPPYHDGSSFCGECHDLPPHGGEGVAPAFFNDHTSFVDCLICHWARRSGERPEAGWSKREDGVMLLGFASGTNSTIDRKALRDAVTGRQVCFDRGLSCSRCHTRGGMEPYIRPGLSPQGQAALENLPDFFTVSKGTKWYFPQRQ